MALAILGPTAAIGADVVFQYDAAGNLTGIFNLASDRSNCGAIGNVCQAPSGSVACCTEGVCGSVAGSLCRQGLPVVVEIVPGTASVPAKGSKQFQASVSNAANPAVSWSVNGIPWGTETVGTIDAEGLYVAPAAVPSPPAVSVEARSVADSTKAATASVTIRPEVLVLVAPTTILVEAGTVQQFTSTVTNAIDPTLTWSVNGVLGGDAVVGTIDGTGKYTAPAVVPTPAGVVVRATSNESPVASSAATATVTAPRIQVGLSPGSPSVTTGQTVQFAVRVLNSSTTTVTWKVNGVTNGNATVGTISTAGLYKAPATTPTPSTVTVSAVAVADGSATGSAPVTISAVPISVSVVPATVTLGLGKTQQFTATVANTTNTGVVWAVNGIVGGSVSTGTVSTAGLYTAPVGVPNPATVSVTATSSADPTKKATSLATVTSATGVLVTVNPSAASLETSLTLQFTATVQGSTNTGVTWRVNNVTGGNSTVGTITTAGLYKAPTAKPNPATVTIAAVSKADTTRSGTATVNVVAPVKVTLSPASASLASGATRQFAATVANATDTTVTWKVNGISGGDQVVGTVTSSGLYSAPRAVPAPAGVSVSAVSNADPTKSGSASVTVTAGAVTVTVSPAVASLWCNATQQFSVAVMNTASAAVTWKVNGVAGGNATVGTISPSGLYAAPASVPTSPSVTISAVSAVDSTKAGSALVTIGARPDAQVIVTPPTAVVQLGSTQQFTAHVTNATDTSVAWAVNDVFGGAAETGTISATGLYTAPSVIPSGWVYVTAYSNADPNFFGDASILFSAPPPVQVSLLPENYYTDTLGSVLLVATVANSVDTSVTWLVNGVVGGNDQVGRIVQSGGTYYYPPAVVDGPTTFTITVVSNEDPSKFATSTINVNKKTPVTLFIAPHFPSVPLGQTIGFLAEIHQPFFNATNVIWKVNDVSGGNSIYGTITSTGAYTAPLALPPGPVTVTVQLVNGGRESASTTVIVTPSAPVVVLPVNTQVQVGGSAYLRAIVLNLTDTSVTWSVNGIAGGNATVGTVVPYGGYGYYTAPAAVPVPSTVSVAAVSIANPANAGTSSVTISETPPIAALWISGPNSVQLGSTISLSMDVGAYSDGSVTWSVNGVVGGNDLVGTITPTGMSNGVQLAIYKAPTRLPNPDAVMVQATLDADPAKFGLQSIALNAIAPPGVSVRQNCPTTVRLGTGTRFVADTQDLKNKAVIWHVNGLMPGNDLTGRIDASGNYRAPTTMPPYTTIPVVAVSADDPTIWSPGYVILVP